MALGVRLKRGATLGLINAKLMGNDVSGFVVWVILRFFNAQNRRITRVGSSKKVVPFIPRFCLEHSDKFFFQVWPLAGPCWASKAASSKPARLRNIS